MAEFRTLYIDMNSFFASVEQQLDPSIRGRPVAISAMEGLVGTCVAASYEAKAYGVKTGTSVRDALRLCPGIVIRPSRHRLYVRYNLRVAAVIDRHAELERIRSVDEFQVALSGKARTLDGAVELVATLKAAVASEVGECLRFSAGIGPNHLLAKIAGKLEKPDGCQWLGTANMPGRLAHLALDDLPGIAQGVLAKLQRAGVHDIAALHALDPRHARAIWGSVEGERFVRALQGMDVPLVETRRGGYGNGKVLAPKYRSLRQAYLVGRWLVGKAIARLRRDERVASSFALILAFEHGGGWSQSIRCVASCDTFYFQRVHRLLWSRMLATAGPHSFASVAIQLGDVDDLARRPGDLFDGTGPAEPTRSETVSAIVDQINRRYGPGAVTIGVEQPHEGFFERG